MKIVRDLLKHWYIPILALIGAIAMAYASTVDNAYIGPPPGYMTSYMTVVAAASTYATQSDLTTGMSEKYNSPVGTTLQYLRGDGTLSTFPTVFGSCYDGTTKRSNCLPYSTVLTVSGGVVTANMTTDGTSGGTSIFPNGLIVGSLNVTCNDSTVPYSASYSTPASATKSIVFTVNRASGVLSVLGLSVLGAPAAANGAVCNIQAMGY